MTRAFSWARGPRSALAVGLPALILGAALACEAAAAPAVLPTGGKVVAGSASIGAPTGFTLRIDQTSARAIIDWSSFSIGKGDKVTFDNGAGITLNRVMGGPVSEIDGMLLATGGVYVLNPNGVVIGRSGVVDVGGDFVASSLALSNQQFLAGGDLTFTGADAGPVTNLGYVVSAEGAVELIAPQVTNGGRIAAAQGDVGLGAGQAVVLHAGDADDGRLSVLVGGPGTSARTTGLIQAAEVELKANGGDIYALAVNPGAGIEATGVGAKDGDVWLIASGGDVTATGAISAHRSDGSGALVETSGASVDFTGLRVTAGEWLLDPVTLTINAAAANTISANLATTNVDLQTTATTASGPGLQTPGAGDILIDAPISWSSGRSLTLDAYHSIDFNADVSVGGGGQVILKTDDGGSGGGYAFAPGISLGFASQAGPQGPVGIDGQALTINGTAFTLIYSEAGLTAVNANLAGDYALAGPLSLQGFVFTDAPIAHDASSPFTGLFEGLGNSISGLSIAQTIADTQTLGGQTWQGSVGLFGVIGAGGTVRDLGLTNVSVVGADNMRVGALAGVSLGTLEDDSSSGAVAVGDTLDPTALGAAEAGGLVGSLRQGGQVLDSQSSASVSGGSAIVGGLVGAETDSSGLISGSSASGDVSVGASTSLQTAMAGGLAGAVDGQVSDAYATAQVSGGAGSWIGGFAGYVNGGVVSQSYASGALLVAGGAGPGASSSVAGGFVATADGGANITNAYALGAVTATGSPYAVVGGFAGVIEGQASVSHVYATGALSGGDQLGGVAGQVGAPQDPNGLGGTLTDAYWDEGTTGATVGYSLQGSGAASSVTGVGGATGLSPYAAATYANLDLGAVWYLIPGETRPILRSEYSTTIQNAHELQLMALDPSASYTLGANIDASETSSASGVWNPATGFSPVGGDGAPAFSGVLDAGGHTISNLFIDFAAASPQTAGAIFATGGAAGLFGEIGPQGVVRDLTLANASVTGQGAMFVGALAGIDEGSIADVAAAGQVTTGAGGASESSSAGGLVGGQFGGAIGGSSSSAAVAGGNDAFVGGLVGTLAAGGQVSGSNASGAVTAGASVSSSAFGGGLVGLAFGFSDAAASQSDPVGVADSFATGPVTGGASSYVGGFVGDLHNGQASDDYATGSVTQTTTGANGDVIGGFAALALAGSSVTGSWSSGVVSTVSGAGGAEAAAGGFVGVVVAGASASYDYSLSPILIDRGNPSLVGGFAGYVSGTISQFYATGLTGGSGAVGGLVGQLASGGGASDGYFDEGTTGQTAAVGQGGPGVALVGVGGATGLSPYAASTYANFDLVGAWYTVDGETRPILRSEYSTTITDAHQLELMSLAPGAAYTVAANFNAGETTSVYGVWNPANGFVPVGTAAAPFTGSLNGQGFTISNLRITVAGGAEQSFDGLATDGFAGLFGVVSGPSALIENINLANAAVTGGAGTEVGALAGALLQGAIVNASSTGSVAGGDALVDGSGNPVSAAAGGLVGIMGSGSATGPGASITGSSSLASVSAGDAFAGGLVGSTVTGSSISGSWAEGPVVVGSTTGSAGEIAEAGGLVGSLSGALVTGSYATGPVIGGGGSSVGGFAGYIGNAQVSGSYATGPVGQVSTSYIFANYAGGFAGYVDTGSTISTSFASGKVSTVGSSAAPPTFAGGFAGYLNGSVSNAYATGAVASTGPSDEVGGFAGEIDAGGAASQVYATGAVSGTGAVGGLAGQLAGALSNSYWDEGTTGQTTGYVPAGGVATTVVGIGGTTGVSPFAAATYAGWDFSQTWSQPSPGEYPELLGVSHVLEVVAGPTTSVYGQYPVYTYKVLGLQDANIQFTAPVAEAPTGVATSTSGWIDVGTYALVPSGLTAVGASGAYRSIYVAGSLTVTPAPLTVSLTGSVEKVYDGTTAATIAPGDLTLTGLVGGDVVAAGAESAAYATKNAGTGIEVTASGLTLTGADAANYAVSASASGAVGKIDPKALTVTLTGTVDKTYDGTTGATLGASNYLLSGVVGGDAVSLNDPTSGTYATKNVGSGIAVSVGGLALTGADAGDYRVAAAASGDVGQIDPKTLTVTLVGSVSKAYDGNTNATLSPANYQLSGVISGDAVQLNDPATGSYATAQAGTGIVVTVKGLAVSGADADDYTVASAASAPIGVITAALSVGQVQIQVITVTDVDVLDQPLTPPPPDSFADALAAAAGLGGQAGGDQGAGATAYTVFPVTQSGAAAAGGAGAPVTGAGNGDLWAGSDLDQDQPCPSGQAPPCKPAGPGR